jgi:hypothetical protein
MTTKDINGRIVAAVIPLVLGMSMHTATAQSAPMILTTPAETPGQFSYAFFDPEGLATDGGWVVIDFHRDPGCDELIGSNLLLFVDPNALNCPLTVEMREWWYRQDLVISGGPWGSLPWEPTFRTPILAEWRGLGAVPVYFVRRAEFLTAVADDVLTVDELKSLSSLLIGQAHEYQFIQHNSGVPNASQTRRPGHTRTVALGVLEGGRSFQFSLTSLDNRVTSIRIAFK